MIRTYAIWERRRAVLYGFIALFLVRCKNSIDGDLCL